MTPFSLILTRYMTLIISIGATLTWSTLTHAQELTEPVKESAQEVTGSAKESAQEVAGSAKESAQDLAGSAKETAQDLAGSAKETAQDLAGSANESAQELTESARDSLREVNDVARDVIDTAQTGATELIDEVKTSRDEALEAVRELESTLRNERDALQAELSSLSERFEQAKQEARRDLISGAQAFSWVFALSPNLDGSLAFELGGDYRYLDRFLLGLNYSQVQRVLRNECDRLSTQSCRAYSEIVDRQLSLRSFGYELPLGDHWQLTFNLNGLLLLQYNEGTSVDITLDRYVSSRGAFTSLQVNTQLELDWHPSPRVSFHLGGSVSPYHLSAEREEGYDSGLVSRTPEGSGQLDNDNNVVYTGQLGNYTKYFYNNSLYFDGVMSMYVRDLIGASDVELSGSARYLSYGARAQRSVIFNGDLVNEESSQDFSKLDLFAKLAFELSFLGLIPSNPMLGVTYTRSNLTGIFEPTISQSVGFTVSFATPPKLNQSRSELATPPPVTTPATPQREEARP